MPSTLSTNAVLLVLALFAHGCASFAVTPKPSRAHKPAAVTLLSRTLAAVPRVPFAIVCQEADVPPSEAGGRGRGRGRGGRGGRGGGRGRGSAAASTAPSAAATGSGGGDGSSSGGGGGGGGRKVKVRYLREQEMESFVQEAAAAQGFDETQSIMLASCARNIYSMGCNYHPSTITLLQEICREPAEQGESWAILLLRCAAGQMPRLRSKDTADVRMAAAKAAAARRRS
jgi:hypothetical protein